MSMNNQGRPTSTGEAFPASIATISGDRGLDHEEGLIFELGHGACGVDLPDVKVADTRLAGQRRKAAIAAWCRSPPMAPIPPPPHLPASRWTKCPPSPTAMSMPRR